MQYSETAKEAFIFYTSNETGKGMHLPSLLEATLQVRPHLLSNQRKGCLAESRFLPHPLGPLWLRIPHSCCMLLTACFHLRKHLKLTTYSGLKQICSHLSWTSNVTSSRKESTEDYITLYNQTKVITNFTAQSLKFSIISLRNCVEVPSLP